MFVVVVVLTGCTANHWLCTSIPCTLFKTTQTLLKTIYANIDFKQKLTNYPSRTCIVSFLEPSMGWCKKIYIYFFFKSISDDIVHKKVLHQVTMQACFVVDKMSVLTLLRWLNTWAWIHFSQRREKMSVNPLTHLALQSSRCKAVHWNVCFYGYFSGLLTSF